MLPFGKHSPSEHWGLGRTFWHTSAAICSLWAFQRVLNSGACHFISTSIDCNIFVSFLSPNLRCWGGRGSSSGLSSYPLWGSHFQSISAPADQIIVLSFIKLLLKQLRVCWNSAAALRRIQRSFNPCLNWFRLCLIQVKLNGMSKSTWWQCGWISLLSYDPATGIQRMCHADMINPLAIEWTLNSGNSAERIAQSAVTSCYIKASWQLFKLWDSSKSWLCASEQFTVRWCDSPASSFSFAFFSSPLSSKFPIEIKAPRPDLQWFHSLRTLLPLCPLHFPGFLWRSPLCVAWPPLALVFGPHPHLPIQLFLSNLPEPQKPARGKSSVATWHCFQTSERKFVTKWDELLTDFVCDNSSRAFPLASPRLLAMHNALPH